MVSDSSNTPMSRYQAEAELELVKLISHVDQAYPWEPGDLRSEAYFEELEQSVAADWPMDGVARYAQTFFSQLDQMWTSPAATETVQTLQAQLSTQFGAQVPQSLLERIAERAQKSIQMNLSLAEQLVQCVNGLLPDWADEDLYVLARPYAFAMRGSSADQLEVALRSVRYAAWTELSGVDQARLSLAIARYAIAQLPDSETPKS